MFYFYFQFFCTIFPVQIYYMYINLMFIYCWPTICDSKPLDQHCVNTLFLRVTVILFSHIILYHNIAYLSDIISPAWN